MIRERNWFCNSDYRYTTSADGKTNTLSMDDKCDMVNVYDRFTIVLQLYFAFSVLAACFLIFILLALCCIRTNCGKCISLLLGFGAIGICCYSLACLIILHVFRYQASGKYASLDWMTSSQLDQLKQADPSNSTGWSLQYYRGLYLQGLVIYTWISFALNCCIEAFKRNAL